MAAGSYLNGFQVARRRVSDLGSQAEIARAFGFTEGQVAKFLRGEVSRGRRGYELARKFKILCGLPSTDCFFDPRVLANEERRRRRLAKKEIEERHRVREELAKVEAAS